MKRWLLAFIFSLTAVLALAPMSLVGQAPTAPYTPPQTRDGRPDLQGIWQAVNTAHWDLEAHNGSLGVPPGHSVVEGGLIRTNRGRWRRENKTLKSAPSSIRKRFAGFRAYRARPTCPIRFRSSRRPTR